MSKQATLTSFFHVRKAASDGADAHAIKKRKVETETSLGKVTETVTKAEVTKLEVQTPDAGEQTPDVSSNAKNGKRRKAEAAPAPPEAEPVLFTVGTTSTSKAKRKLNMDRADDETAEVTKDRGQKNVIFEQKGPLSPSKKAKQTEEAAGAPAPARKHSAASLNNVMDKLNRMDSKEVKAKLKTVNKLSDLQAQFKSLKKDPNLAKSSTPQTAKRALFQEDKKVDVKPEIKAPLPPLMSPKKVATSAAPMVKTVLSPGKASPRKAIPAFVRYQELAQPDQFLPLPNRYKALTEVFRSVDVIVSMKFNRKEIIRVPDLKPAVQNITRKTFSDFYLRQIRCVFPKAYKYVWEKINDRLGRHTGDFVLHMSPDHGVGTKSNMSPLIKVERLKMFQHALLNIVHDYHREFLASLGISGLADSQVNRWHKDFSLEAVPDIQEEPLPPKPEVEKARSAKEMLEKLAGVNERLEASLKNMKEAAVKTAESDGDKPAAAGPPPVIRKELRGLKPELIQKILANEKAKQIKEMTQSSEERKDLEQLEELVSLAPVIVNCHRAHRKGAAVPIDTLAQVTSDSCGRKSKAAMLPLIRLFLKTVPQCMEIKTIERVQYVKLKKTSPDVNQVKKILEDVVANAKTKK